ncbi:MAG TPA: histidine--tRNA ligase [Bacteroidales bacterium]|nr:histidine--tRNA ligase [Bacteroidales bacterium]HCI55738.1 histidine--tRNA ligase [Bacteroidales bacterium]HOU96608.1 histidine--tRNA ligase [Bacteroidales bacterium]HQG35833.1 histidine--tRNA ligase [Bacteroidales bacterium]HQG53303.1 histidine--tRNA ligase [Bacteroidales bacterium]
MPLKPSIPKGTRDFSPEEVIRREYILNTIKEVFKLFGYQPLETPAIENLSTLLGKYGEEGDKLLFRILNSGDYLSGLSADDLKNPDLASISSKICEKGLRYDLTVPFARYIVQHRNEIIFPFKRYQIQPVWRADRPQKGRYREFTQCDADVIGSNSLLNEFELLEIIDEIFSRLQIPVIIKLNNRKILSGIAEVAGESEHIKDIYIAIDKLEKAGKEAVINELLSKGVSQNVIEGLKPLFEISGTNLEKINELRKILNESPEGLKGIDEIETILKYNEAETLRNKIELNLTLARGLEYYTGAIIEVKAENANIGSICGGGRYDNLTGVFGLEGVSGVGVSFGADRIYDVMVNTGKFSKIDSAPSKVLILNFGKEELTYAFKILKKLHKAGISAQIYPDDSRISKQMTYANSLKIPFVVIAGEDEIKNCQVTLKNMTDGSQKRVDFNSLETLFRS